MNRRLLTPRWLAVHAVVIVAVFGCALLGWWQLGRAREQHAQSLRPAANATAPAVALDTLLAPAERLPLDAVGRPVSVEGEYDESSQVLVPGREVSGHSGYAVLTPLVADGVGVIIVRGWVPSTSDAAPRVPSPPAGPVTVTGVLGGGEDAPPLPEALPAGQLGSVHLPSLLNLLPYPIYDAVVSRTTESPSPAQPLVAMPTAVPVVGSWPLQNVFYAMEWWIFGLAAIAMWVSGVRRRPEPRVTGNAGTLATPAP